MKGKIILRPPVNSSDDNIGYCISVISAFGKTPALMHCHGSGSVVVDNIPLFGAMGMNGNQVAAPFVIESYRYHGNNHNVISGTPVFFDAVCSFLSDVAVGSVNPQVSWLPFAETTQVGQYDILAHLKYKDQNAKTYLIEDGGFMPPLSELLIHYTFEGTETLKMLMLNSTVYDDRGNFIAELVNGNCLSHPDVLGLDYDQNMHTVVLWLEGLQLRNGGQLFVVSYFRMTPAASLAVTDGNDLDLLKGGIPCILDSIVAVGRRLLEVIGIAHHQRRTQDEEITDAVSRVTMGVRVLGNLTYVVDNRGTFGCMDTAAINYDSLATMNCTSCCVRMPQEPTIKNPPASQGSLVALTISLSTAMLAFLLEFM